MKAKLVSLKGFWTDFNSIFKSFQLHKYITIMVVIYIILARFSLLMRPLRRVLIMQSILRIMNWYKSLERNYLQSRKKWKTQNQALLSIERQNISNWLSIKLKQTWVQIIETISRDDLNIDPPSLFMVDRSLPIPYSTDPEPNRSILTLIRVDIIDPMVLLD